MYIIVHEERFSQTARSSPSPGIKKYPPYQRADYSLEEGLPFDI